MSTVALNPNDAIARVREVGNSTNEYIKFADAKAGLILTFVAAVGSLVGVTAPATLAAAEKAHWVALTVVIGTYVALAVSIALVLWFTVEAVYPRTDPAQAPLVSFPDIAQLTPDDYASRVEQSTAEQWLRDCAKHNVTLARIACAKFNALRRAMYWGRIALYSAYAAALMYGVARAAGVV